MQNKSVLLKAIYLCSLASQSVYATKSVGKDSGVTPPPSLLDIIKWDLSYSKTIPPETKERESIRNAIQLDLDQAARAYQNSDYNEAKEILTKTPDKLQRYCDSPQAFALSKREKKVLKKQKQSGELDQGQIETAPQTRWANHTFTQILELLADSCFLAGDYNKAEQLYGQALNRLTVTSCLKCEFSLTNQIVPLRELIHSYGQILHDDHHPSLIDIPPALQASTITHYQSARIAEATENIHGIAMINDLQKQFANADKIFETILPQMNNKMSFTTFGTIVLDRPSQTQTMEMLYNRIISAIEKDLGPDNLSIATRLDLLSQWYLNGHHYDRAQARIALIRAISIKEKSFGKDSPKLVGDLEKLNKLSIGNNSYNDIWAKRLLEIREKSFGANPSRDQEGAKPRMH